MAKIIARGHHERYNGKGYPDGLKGDDIPLCCRIVSVANVYCSCVSTRVYRKSISHQEACAIINAGRGEYFDPRVVGAFAAVSSQLTDLE
jgi:putative two-component system response regulator